MCKNGTSWASLKGEALEPRISSAKQIDELVTLGKSYQRSEKGPEKICGR